MIKKKLFLTLICILFSLASAEGMKRPGDDGECSPAKRQKIKEYEAAYTKDIINYLGNVIPTPLTNELSFNPPLNKVNELHSRLKTMETSNFSFYSPSYTNYYSETTTVNFLKVDGDKKFVIKHSKSVNGINKGRNEYFKCRCVYEKLSPDPAKFGISRVEAPLEVNDDKSFVSIFSFTPGEDIYSILSASSGQEIHNLLTAVAHYLANFHYDASKKNQEEKPEINIVTSDGRLLEKPEVFLLEKQKLKDKAKKLELHFTNPDPLWDINQNEIINETRKQKFYNKLTGIAASFYNNIDNLIDSGPTTIHGDAHGGNILSSKDISKTSVLRKCLNYLRKDPNFWSWHKYVQRVIAKTQAVGILSQGIFEDDTIKLIDYESMDYAIDPAVDVGRFIGSLWQWGARDSKEPRETLYPKIAEWQRLIKEKYCAQLKKNDPEKKIFSDKTIEIIENNIDFYKNFTFRLVINSDKNKNKLIMKRKLMNFWLEELNLVLLPEIEKDGVESKERAFSNEEKEKHEIEKRDRAAKRAAIKLFEFHATQLKGPNIQTIKIVKFLNSTDKIKEYSVINDYHSLLSDLNSPLIEDEENPFKAHFKSTKKLKEEFNKDNLASFYGSIFSLYFHYLSPYYGAGSNCDSCTNPSLLMTKVLGEDVGECWVCGHEEFF